jgi:hypothetical protein
VGNLAQQHLLGVGVEAHRSSSIAGNLEIKPMHRITSVQGFADEGALPGKF